MLAQAVRAEVGDAGGAIVGVEIIRSVSEIARTVVEENGESGRVQVTDVTGVTGATGVTVVTRVMGEWRESRYDGNDASDWGVAAIMGVA